MCVCWLGGLIGWRRHTSLAVTTNAFQSTRGKIFINNFGFGAILSDTSSQSFGWRGKDAEEDLQAFTAQERKLRVRTFILVAFLWDVLGRKAKEKLVGEGEDGGVMRVVRVMSGYVRLRETFFYADLEGGGEIRLD